MVDTSAYLDRALCKVFAVCLRDSDANQGAEPPVIYLQGLAEVTHSLHVGVTTKLSNVPEARKLRQFRF